MRDKDLIALITIFAFIIYFFPNYILKFIAIGVLLFFSPGFFVLKLIYRNMKIEELVILSFGMAIAISGTVALALAACGALRPEWMFLSVGIITILGYFLSSSIEISPVTFRRPDQFTVIMIAMMLTLIAIWGSYEYETSPYREVDIAINSWPSNATTNTTLNFKIMVVNQNYGPANCTVVFYLNGHYISDNSTYLSNGHTKIFNFQGTTNITGKNLATFNLYVNGKYYTNVHMFFEVKS